MLNTMSNHDSTMVNPLIAYLHFYEQKPLIESILENCFYLFSSFITLIILIAKQDKLTSNSVDPKTISTIDELLIPLIMVVTDNADAVIFTIIINKVHIIKLSFKFSPCKRIRTSVPRVTLGS